jgi:hypothetical protein
MELISLAPQDFGIAKDEWTLPDLVDVVMRENVIENVSPYTIRREITRCLAERPELCERVRLHAQDQPGAPAGNQNAEKHGAYSDLELSAEEESRVVELTKRLLDDFSQKDEVGMKLAQTITEFFIRIERTNDKIGADAMKRLNGKLRRAIKKLKTRRLEGNSSERKITPAEWASDLLESCRKWEASQKPNR